MTQLNRKLAKKSEILKQLEQQSRERTISASPSRYY
jgi:hypothetical protein